VLLHNTGTSTKQNLQFIEGFYNHKRIHSEIGYLSPEQLNRNNSRWQFSEYFVSSIEKTGQIKPRKKNSEKNRAAKEWRNPTAQYHGNFSEYL